MDEKEQQAWDECLPLWKALSELPTKELKSSDYTCDIKNKALNKLGIKIRKHGCPFCNTYSDCVDCPISGGMSVGCLNTPYFDWSCGVGKQKHYKSKAKKFYNYLLKRYEERKKE